jgi:hypothetical protein
MAAVTSYAVPVSLVPVADALRGILDGELPDAEGTIWHGHPVWRSAAGPVAGYKAYTSYVTLMLWRGARIEDPTGSLRPSGPAGMASVKFSSLADLDESAVRDWLRQL